MALSGATDRTNEYSQVEFSLSRVTELDLKNNSELYLDIRKETITVIQTQDALDLLKKGTDPMAVFTFKVKGVTRK